MISVLQEIRDQQLGLWKMARVNYEGLGHTQRKLFKLGSLQGAFQYNPGRMVSTGAKIDKQSIISRPCFLCKENRPKEQLYEEIIPGWEFLVNPFPIFPLHFTIASTEHIPQQRMPIEMVEMAEKLPGMCIFFNGAKAGASAPDHQHCQAVMASELPLMNYLEDNNDPLELPYKVIYERITPDETGIKKLNSIIGVKGRDGLTGLSDYRLINSYVWIGKDGILRVCVIPRSNHRPSCYPSDNYDIEGKKSFMVSPGAIDMAGIVILPREQDFNEITDNDLKKIYSETALSI